MAALALRGRCQRPVKLFNEIYFLGVSLHQAEAEARSSQHWSLWMQTQGTLTLTRYACAPQGGHGLGGGRRSGGEWRRHQQARHVPDCHMREGTQRTSVRGSRVVQGAPRTKTSLVLIQGGHAALTTDVTRAVPAAVRALVSFEPGRLGSGAKARGHDAAGPVADGGRQPVKRLLPAQVCEPPVHRPGGADTGCSV